MQLKPLQGGSVLDRGAAVLAGASLLPIAVRFLEDGRNTDALVRDTLMVAVSMALYAAGLKAPARATAGLAMFAVLVDVMHNTLMRMLRPRAKESANWSRVQRMQFREGLIVALARRRQLQDMLDAEQRQQEEHAEQ